ncbi:Hypothetical Protein RRSL_01388 [Ralstonia solanacearum UW551]|uniref:Uncharacterized protein n=1 Tax=Ralstonia solanacearum (strain UW551) TaxID=342110 RepID=A0AB33VA83_RALSU|nr:Hypothetical Protein RRSL_01388 [Ralstonia solanacearum UW551]
MALERETDRRRLGAGADRRSNPLRWALKRLACRGVVCLAWVAASTIRWSYPLLGPAGRLRRQPQKPRQPLMCPQRGPLAAPTRARTLPTLGEKNGRRDPRGHFSLSLLFCYSG